MMTGDYLCCGYKKKRNSTKSVKKKEQRQQSLSALAHIFSIPQLHFTDLELNISCERCAFSERLLVVTVKCITKAPLT